MENSTYDKSYRPILLTLSTRREQNISFCSESWSPSPRSKEDGKASMFSIDFQFFIDFIYAI
jgi:hypothetical protein